jgi:hypothetical protein
VATSTKGDLKTFAFASLDAKALAAEVTGVPAPGGASSVSYDAVELLDEAQRLERLAESAKHRLKGADSNESDACRRATEPNMATDRSGVLPAGRSAPRPQRPGPRGRIV